MKKDKSISASNIIKQKINHIESRRDYIALFRRFLMVALVGYFLFSQVFLVMQFHGNTMSPALKDGDLYLICEIRTPKEWSADDLERIKGLADEPKDVRKELEF